MSPPKAKAKEPKDRPCPACYRPVLASLTGYCDRCEETGAARRHRDRQPQRHQRRAPERPVTEESDPAPAPAPAAAVATQAPPAQHPRRRVRRPGQRRRQGNQADPRSKGARTAPGRSGSDQHPARDRALELFDHPGEPSVLHTYQHEKRVKAAIWYLRHRAGLPEGLTFWRDGCSVVGVYGDRPPPPPPPPPEPPPQQYRPCPNCGIPAPYRGRGRPQRCHGCKTTPDEWARRAILSYLTHEGPSDEAELVAYADEIVHDVMPLADTAVALWSLVADGLVEANGYGPEETYRLAPAVASAGEEDRGEPKQNV